MKHLPKKSIRIAAVCAAGLLAAAAALFFFTRPSFTVKEEAVVEAGSTFHPLALVETVRFAQKEEIAVSGELNLSAPGEYPLTFTLGWQTRKASVTVVDTTPPTLSASNPDAAYSVTAGADGAGTAEDVFRTFGITVTDATVSGESGYTAVLDTSGVDLSRAGSYPAALSVKDLSGNEALFHFTVLVTAPDTTPPVISGASDTAIEAGDPFDPKAGVSVTDDRDTSPALTVEPASLDTGKAGTYTIVYTAKDASGNTAVVKRRITVKPAAVRYRTDGGAEWDASGISGQPYLVAVNRALNTLTVYGKDGDGNYTVPVKAIVCSVGRSGHTTPAGRFQTLERYRWRLMIDGTYAQYAIRIKGGIMFHSVPYFSPSADTLEYEEFNKLGSPASLGCIRMQAADIKWLYDNCPEGFPTVIYDDTVSPGPLGKPSAPKIDTGDTKRRGWDPTDQTEGNPWLS